MRQFRYRTRLRAGLAVTAAAASIGAALALPVALSSAEFAAAAPVAAAAAPVFTSPPASTFLSDTNTRFTVSADCSPACTFAVSVGSLPSGVTLTSEGLLVGVPPLQTVGVHRFVITANNSAGAATQNFTLTVEQPTAIGVEGSDGQMWAQAPQLGLGWHPLGGKIIAPPAVAATYNPSPDLNGDTPTAPLFIATGTDKRLYIRSLTAGWQLLGPVTGACIGGPAADITGTYPNGPFTLTVACRGLDNALWENSTTWSGSGLPRFTTKWARLGGLLTAAPAEAAMGSTMRFFVRGTNGQIFTRAMSSGYAAMPWFCIGAPTAVSPANVSWTMFACQGTNHALWFTTGSAPGGPSDWNNLASLGGTLIGGPAVTATNPYLLAEGTDHAIWERTETAGWMRLGGTAVGGIGAAALD